MFNTYIKEYFFCEHRKKRQEINGKQEKKNITTNDTVRLLNRRPTTVYQSTIRFLRNYRNISTRICTLEKNQEAENDAYCSQKHPSRIKRRITTP